MKRILPTIIFYSIAFVAILGFNKLSPGGPCVPGGGDALLLFLIPLAVGLFARRMWFSIKKDRWINFIRSSIHIAGIFLLVTYIMHR